jgi:hypothetical protein
MHNPYIRYPFAPCIINTFLSGENNWINSSYLKYVLATAKEYDLDPVDVLVGGGL